MRNSYNLLKACMKSVHFAKRKAGNIGIEEQDMGVERDTRVREKWITF